MAYRERDSRDNYHRRSNGDSSGAYVGGGGGANKWGSSDRRRGGDSNRGGEPHRGGDWGSSRGRYGGSDYSSSRNSFGRVGGGVGSSGGSRDGERGGRPFSYPRRDFQSDRRGGYSRPPPRDEPRDPYRSYESSEKSSMTIAAADVGKIIGRGGSTVKDLQIKSGAKIKITNNNNHVDSKVDLFGSTEQRDKAEELINELLNQSRPTKQQRTYDDDNHSNE